jgi:hypothetical protein
MVYNEYERQARMAERLDTPFGLLDIASILMDMLDCPRTVCESYEGSLKDEE